MSNAISATYNKYPDKWNMATEETIGRIRWAHEKNITHGSEFIDDAIRIKDQPFNNSELNEQTI